MRILRSLSLKRLLDESYDRGFHEGSELRRIHEERLHRIITGIDRRMDGLLIEFGEKMSKLSDEVDSRVQIQISVIENGTRKALEQAYSDGLRQGAEAVLDKSLAEILDRIDFGTLYEVWKSEQDKEI